MGANNRNIFNYQDVEDSQIVIEVQLYYRPAANQHASSLEDTFAVLFTIGGDGFGKESCHRNLDAAHAWTSPTSEARNRGAVDHCAANCHI
ncbi:hypothetical protein TNCV_2249831 [Trichonephila clavipes]|nr:hypothetical protein TNCV_2249831 [Trichonephila clavipes]